MDIKEKNSWSEGSTKDDKEGDSDETKGCLGKVFYK
jgi:hypothetical protein